MRGNFFFPNVRAKVEVAREISVNAIKFALENGARGLRSVVEGVMLDCMFDAPSHPDIEEIHITRDCIEGGKQPTIVKKAV